MGFAAGLQTGPAGSCAGEPASPAVVEDGFWRPASRPDATPRPEPVQLEKPAECVGQLAGTPQGAGGCAAGHLPSCAPRSSPRRCRRPDVRPAGHGREIRNWPCRQWGL